MTEYDTGSIALEQLAISYEPSDRNEATTRLQLIDTLLFEVLAWSRDECSAEDSLDGEYTDYSLGVPARRIVVEAKREGHHFLLPDGAGTRVIGLATLLRGNRDLEAAIRQAARYCSTRGIQLGVVANGHQLVAFIGSRDDGVAPLQGRAMVFRSLEDMSTNFVEVWNALSHDGVASGNLVRLLTSDSRPLPPEKLSNLLFGYPGLKARNNLEIELDILGELFIEDIARAKELEGEFLEACYCTSGVLSQYALVSKDILRTRYYETVNRKTQQVTAAATEKEDVAPALMDAMLERGFSRRPIVLLGDVGVGKTTFIKHLVAIDAKDELERALVLNVDFGSQPALRRDLEPFVLEQFAEQLRETYGLDIYESDFVHAVYNGEINRFRVGIYGRLAQSDPEEFSRRETEMLAELLSRPESHLRRTLEHLRGAEQRNAVVFFDNIDQRPDEFQDQVYLIAQSLADSWRLPVFVSLRPATFYRSKREGSLSAYQPRVFTISPPRIDQVILKRLKFAQKLIQENVFSLGSSGITVDSSTLRDYVQVLIESIDRSDELAECLDNISAGNVRRALDVLNSFIGSGHVNTRKILKIYRESGSYYVPLHEFLRAVIYGDHEYYDPTASFVPNAFDVSSPTGREHFLVPILVTYLTRQSQGSLSDKGFLPIRSIYEFLQGLGFLPDQIDFALERSSSSGLIETSFDTDADRAVGGERARVTQAGAYLVERLLRSFVYFDAVVVDTPIINDEVRSSLGMPKLIQQRLQRAERFVSYLDSQWIALEGLQPGFDWPSCSRAVRHQISNVERRLAQR